MGNGLTLVVELLALCQQLEGLSINIQAKVGARGRFYGSVTSADIAEEITRLLGREFDRRKIELEEPIRQLGSYEVPVKLAGDLVPKLKVIVEERKG